MSPDAAVLLALSISCVFFAGLAWCTAVTSGIYPRLKRLRYTLHWLALLSAATLATLTRQGGVEAAYSPGHPNIPVIEAQNCLIVGLVIVSFALWVLTPLWRWFGILPERRA